MAKQLLFEDRARAKLQKGVQTISDAVAITMGPTGRNVIIDKNFGNPLVTKDGVTVSIGMGQTSRVDAVQQVIWKAGDKAKGCVLASEAFFPFRDSIDEIAPTGVTAIVQPGGSIKDKEVITAANEHKVPMVFTGVRSFLH